MFRECTNSQGREITHTTGLVKSLFTGAHTHTDMHSRYMYINMDRFIVQITSLQNDGQRWVWQGGQTPMKGLFV